MRKFLLITIPIITLISFILIMLSCSILKNPLGEDNKIPETIQLILNDIESENWENASNKTENLSNEWERIVKRIQFSSEIDEINYIKSSIARLRGAIMAKDKPNSFIELNDVYERWKEL